MYQKAFGNWGSALVSVPLGMFAWRRGHPQEFRSSETVARGYCEECGTPFYVREDSDTNIELAIGSFDEPNRVDPLVSQAGVESRLTWFNDMHKLTEFRTSGYRTPGDMEKLKSLQHPDHDRWGGVTVG
jgi:hypothetical protein